MFHAITGAVGTAGAVELVTMPNVLGMAEVLVQTARTATGRLAFGPPGQAWRVPEAETGDAPGPSKPPDAAPRGKREDARPSRRPTMRDHLLATSRHTWPALAHSRAGRRGAAHPGSCDGQPT